MSTSKIVYWVVTKYSPDEELTSMVRGCKTSDEREAFILGFHEAADLYECSSVDRIRPQVLRYPEEAKEPIQEVEDFIKRCKET